MPKTMLMLAFACLLAHGAGAQTSEPYLHHNPNDTTLVFGDNVNLRAAPKKAAAVVGRQHAGQKVKIVAQTNELLTLDGRTEYWFEVAPLGQDVRGFMWGGLLAWAWADTAGLCFALNVVSDKKEGPGLEFRAIRDGQVLSSAVFYEYFIGYDNQVYRPSLVVSGNHGLAGFEHVISLNMDIPTEVC